MRNLIIASLLLLTSCTFNQKVDTIKESEYCVEIDNTDKIICFDMPVDTTSKYIYVDEFGVKNIYTNLQLHYMMVVEIKQNVVTLSNISNSVTIRWEGKLPKIQYMYYVISSEKVLKETVLVKYPEYMLPQDEVVEDGDIEIIEP